MNRSREGTYKTTAYVNQDSEKYLERTTLGQSKCGSIDTGKDAAHIAGYGLFNAIHTHTRGRPLSEENRDKIRRQLNSDENLRIKSQYGNRVLDERRDARIAHALHNDIPIEGDSTSKRAALAYKQFEKILEAPSVARTLGDAIVLKKDGTRTTVRSLANGWDWWER